MSDTNGNNRVTIRLDKTPAVKVRTQVSTDHSALGLWSGSRSIPFLKKMFNKEKMIIRAQPFSDSPVTAEYDIRGLEQSIAPLRAACNW